MNICYPEYTLYLIIIYHFFSYKYPISLYHPRAILHPKNTYYPKYAYYPIIIHHPFFYKYSKTLYYFKIILHPIHTFYPTATPHVVTLYYTLNIFYPKFTFYPIIICHLFPINILKAFTTLQSYCIPNTLNIPNMNTIQ